MQSFPVGFAVNVTVRFEDLNGDPVEPTGITVRVYDANEQDAVTPFSPSITAGDTEVELQIPGTVNAVAGVRTIEVTMHTDQGDIATPALMYLVQPRIRLQVLQNSFQTYSAAMLVASRMPALDGWEGAEDLDRLNALSAAFDRLTRLPYRIKTPLDPLDQARLTEIEWVIAPRNWELMTLDRWNDYPQRFRQALAKAQIAEANEILSGDVVSRKRREGLLSESIGESSMMFRSGKPIELGIAKATYEYLTGYLDFRLTLTRS